MMSADGNSDNFFDGRWIREANEGENFYEENHLLGHFLICYRLNLKSKSPLKEDQVRLALWYLCRKCPSLQFCFGMKDGKRWLRRSTNPEIDFKVLHGKGVREVRECLQAYRYNSETGPLFCVRLLIDSPDPALDTDDPEPASFHSSYMLFGLHHSIGDGTTNMYIMRYFVSLLNDVICERAIDKDEPLGVLKGNEYIAIDVGEKRAILQNDPELLDKISREFEVVESHSPYMVTGFPKPNEKRMTHSLEYIVDQDITAKFFKKCREEKVTINSGFSAAANVALVDLLQENDIVHNSYIIQNFHLVNLRRYWEKKIPHVLGVHTGYPLLVRSEVPGNLGSNYWEYARSLHERISKDLREKKPVFSHAFITLLSGEMSAAELLDDTKPFLGDFIISNMGDVTPLATEGGEEVRITHILRSTSNHMLNTVPMSIICHTFRGKFTMTFDYNSAAIRQDVIMKFCKQIVKRIQIVL
ncbi:uncharacterized protein [Macrobrachium rosenbergii]|uniref:uncharacterized protein n=1 Tax=Macrobrachium rosenbergii TaxID=79674 RepID=UPI0034D435CE